MENTDNILNNDNNLINTTFNNSEDRLEENEVDNDGFLDDGLRVKPAMTNTSPAMTNTSPAMTNTSPAMTNTLLAMTNTSPAMTNIEPKIDEIKETPFNFESTPPVGKPTSSPQSRDGFLKNNEVLVQSVFNNPNMILANDRTLIKHDLENQDNQNSFELQSANTHYFEDYNGNIARVWFDKENNPIKQEEIYKSSYSVENNLSFDLSTANNIDKDNTPLIMYDNINNSNIKTTYNDPLEISYINAIQQFGEDSMGYVGMRKIENDVGFTEATSQLFRGVGSNVVGLGRDFMNWTSSTTAKTYFRMQRAMDRENFDEDIFKYINDASIELRDTQDVYLNKLGLIARDVDGKWFKIGNVLGSVATSILIANPAITGALYFASSQQNLEEELHKNGIDENKAWMISNSTALIIGALENLGDTKLLNFIHGDKILSSLAKAGLSEGLEEGSQNLTEDFIMKTFGGREKSWRDVGLDAVESSIYGAIGGGFGVGIARTPEIAKNTKNFISQKVYNKARMRGLDSKDSLQLTKNIDKTLNNEELINEAIDVIKKQSQPETFYKQDIDKTVEEVKRQIASGEALNNYVELWEQIDKIDLEEYNKKIDTFKNDLKTAKVDEKQTESIITLNNEIIIKQAQSLGISRNEALKISPLPTIVKDTYKNSIKTENDYVKFINYSLNHDYVGYKDDFKTARDVKNEPLTPTLPLKGEGSESAQLKGEGSESVQLKGEGSESVQLKGEGSDTETLNQEKTPIYLTKGVLMHFYNQYKNINKDTKELEKKLKGQKSLLERIRELGGIYDLGGDIKAILDKRGDRNFLLAKQQYITKRNRQTGETYTIDRSADNLFKTLLQEGYQFYDEDGNLVKDYRIVNGVSLIQEAIREEVAGKKQYKQEAEEINFEIERLNQFNEELDRMGLKVEDLEIIADWNKYKKQQNQKVLNQAIIQDLELNQEVNVLDISKIIKNNSNKKNAKKLIWEIAENGEQIKTLSEPWVIDIINNSNKKNHLLNSSNTGNFSQKDYNRRNIELNSLKDIINNSILIERVENKKQNLKPNVEEYFYFYTAIQDGKNIYLVKSIAEKFKGENDLKNVHLYDMFDIQLSYSIKNKNSSYKGDMVNPDAKTLGVNNSIDSITIKDILSNVKDFNGQNALKSYLEENQKVLNQENKNKDLTKTENFKNWFGNSQVVNNKGEPLVVYHGSPKRNIETFEEGHINYDIIKMEDSREGFYFTNNENVANTYSTNIYERGRNPEARNGKIYNTYLSIKKPLVIDYKKQIYNSEKNLKYIKKAKNNDYDGVIFKNIKDAVDIERNIPVSTSYVVFSPNQIKSVENKGTYSLEDNNIYNQTTKTKNPQYVDLGNPNLPRAQIDITHNIITLFENADKSSIVHELGHYYMEMLSKFANSGSKKAQDQIKNLSELLGVKNGDFKNITIQQQEVFARSWEGYLMEKAIYDNDNDPRIEFKNKPYLVEIFENFKEWLKSVYENIKDLKINLSPEIINWFDNFVINDNYYKIKTGNEKVNLKTIKNKINVNTDEALITIQNNIKEKLKKTTKELESLILNQSAINQEENSKDYQNLSKKIDDKIKELEDLKTLDINDVINKLDVPEIYKNIIQEKIQNLLEEKSKNVLEFRNKLLNYYRNENKNLKKELEITEENSKEAGKFAYTTGRENILLKENVKRKISENETLNKKVFGITKRNEALMDDYIEQIYTMRSDVEQALNNEINNLRDTFGVKENQQNKQQDNKKNNNDYLDNTKSNINPNDVYNNLENINKEDNYWQELEKDYKEKLDRKGIKQIEDDANIQASALYEEYKKLDSNKTSDDQIRKDVDKFFKNDFDIIEYVKQNRRQKITDEERERAKQEKVDYEKKQKKPKTIMNKNIETVIDAHNYYTLGVNERIRSISQDIFYKIIKSESFKTTEAKQYADKIEPFIDKMIEIRNSNTDLYGDFILNWNWKDKASMVEWLENNNLTEEFKEVNKVLNELYKRQLEVGVDVPYSEMYMPTQVKDVKELMKAIENDLDINIFGDLEAQAKKRNLVYGTPEYIAFVNQYLRGFSQNAILLSPTNFTKKLTLERNMENLKYLKYYEDPLISLINYINGTVNNVNERSLFGKLTEEDAKTIQKIGRENRKLDYLNKVEAKKYKENQIKRLKSKKALLEHDIQKVEYVYNKNNSNQQENITDTSIKTDNSLEIKLEDLKYKLEKLNKEIDFYTFIDAEKIKEFRRKEIKENIEKLKSNISENANFTIEESIGKFIADKNLDYETSNKLKSLLVSLYGPQKQSSNFVNRTQAISSTLFLSGFRNAINQLPEIANSFYKNELINTGVALLGSKEYSKATKNLFKDMGLDNDVFNDVTNNKALSKITKFVFKMNGLTMIDTFGKNTFLKSAVVKTINDLKIGNQKTIAEFEGYLGNDAPSTIKEFLEFDGSKKLSKNAMAYLYLKLSEVQPLTRGDKTQAYLDNPNSRLMYGLKSYFIKQYTSIIRDTIGEVKKGNYMKASKNLLRMQLYAWFVGIPIEYIKDFLFRIDDDDESSLKRFVGKVFDNLLMNNVINRYIGMRLLKKGPAALIPNQTYLIYNPAIDLWYDITNPIFSKEFKNEFLNKNVSIYRDVKAVVKKVDKKIND